MSGTVFDKPEPWSNWELDDLALCIANGRSVSDAADLLCRSEGAVKRKAEELRLVERNVMKDQLTTVLEAVRLAQDILEVEGHSQATLDTLRSLLCNENVADAVRALSYQESPSTVPQDTSFQRDWRERSQAA